MIIYGKVISIIEHTLEANGNCIDKLPQIKLTKVSLLWVTIIGVVLSYSILI